MDNSTRSLLYKAKIYELFSLIFKKTKEIDLDQCPFLNNDENLKKIAKAKDVILKDIKNPPSLIELSKTIDLSLKNLKKVNRMFLMFCVQGAGLKKRILMQLNRDGSRSSAFFQKTLLVHPGTILI